MSTELKKDTLKKLEPVKFPDDKGNRVVFKVKSTPGKSTKEVIAEMKRLSKKDIFVAE